MTCHRPISRPISRTTQRSFQLSAFVAAWLAGGASALSQPAPSDVADQDAGATDPQTAIVAYRITDGRRIDHSLTERPGNPLRGRALFFEEARAGCAVCHHRGTAEEDLHLLDTAGPGLNDLRAAPNAAEIRLWIVAPQVRSLDTSMPAYYQAGQRSRPDDPLYGGPRLTAQEIEDLVAFLTLPQVSAPNVAPLPDPTVAPEPQPQAAGVSQKNGSDQALTDPAARR